MEFVTSDLILQLIEKNGEESIKEIIESLGGYNEMEESLQEEITELQQKEKTLNFYIEAVTNKKAILETVLETVKKYKNG